MTPFVRLRSPAAPLPERDIDTDIIFPARFLLITAKTGLGRYAFYERRFGKDGAPRSDFPLNQPTFAGAAILVAGSNFGCGSSREHAVWALADLGVRCVISESFGEIFYSNCFKSGVLPITVAADVLAELSLRAAAGETFTVDLQFQRVELDDGAAIPFQIDDWRRNALLNGWDEITTILNTRADEIGRFEAARRQQFPWLFANSERASWPIPSSDKS